MKITFLHYTCGLFNRGSEVSTQTLAVYFASKKHKIRVYQSGQPTGKEIYRIAQIKLPFLPKDSKSTSLVGKILERTYLDRNSLLVLFFSLKVVPQLLKDRPDIIIPTNGFWQIIISKFIKLFTKSKIILIGRAGIGWTDRDNLKLNPDLFIALTNTALLWAKNINSKVKAINLPNAINLKSFLHNKNLIKINLKKPIVLTVAALTAYKQIDKLVIACSQIPDVSLLIVGKGELLVQLTNLCDQYLNGRYLIKNFPYAKMASVYKACDLFVLLSDKREAFGRVLLEAKACGLPIVTTSIPSRRNIVGPSGIFIESLDKEALVKAIKRGLLKGKSTVSKIQASKFDIKRVGPQYEKVFLKLINK